jgi:hypothetical protein
VMGEAARRANRGKTVVVRASRYTERAGCRGETDGVLCGVEAEGELVGGSCERLGVNVGCELGEGCCEI